jgi:hypothetical protein
MSQFTTRQKIDYILRKIEATRGDDLERAKKFFAEFSEQEMNEQHGQSGRTRREVLKGYEESRALHDEAFAYLMSVL